VIGPRLKTYSTRTTCHSTHTCAGCNQPIPPGVEHLDHELWHQLPGGSLFEDIVFECLPCAARNGRPGIAEPDVPEQPLIPDGIA
jgi:hypothetical protein